MAFDTAQQKEFGTVLLQQMMYDSRVCPLYMKQVVNKFILRNAKLHSGPNAKIADLEWTNSIFRVARHEHQQMVALMQPWLASVEMAIPLAAAFGSVVDTTEYGKAFFANTKQWRATMKTFKGDVVEVEFLIFAEYHNGATTGVKDSRAHFLLLNDSSDAVRMRLAHL